MHQKEDQRNGMIALSFLVGALVLSVIFVGGNSYFQQERYKTIYRQYLSVPNPELQELRTRENIALESYQWRDQEKGEVTIPIERAMDLVVQESAAGGGSSQR